jgi:cytochrome c-type biogenesis protein CcmH
MTRRTLWILLGVVTLVALAIGARSDADRSEEERLWAIASGVRCPTCAGQSIATSGSVAAESLRAQIRADIEDGRTDDQIRARLAAGAYGEDVLLNPPRSGFAALVWIVPVMVVVVAFGGLAIAFRRWEKQDGGPSRQDRALVAAALDTDPDDSHGEGAGR